MKNAGVSMTLTKWGRRGLATRHLREIRRLEDCALKVERNGSYRFAHVGKSQGASIEIFAQSGDYGYVFTALFGR